MFVCGLEVVNTETGAGTNTGASCLPAADPGVLEDGCHNMEEVLDQREQSFVLSDCLIVLCGFNLTM